MSRAGRILEWLRGVHRCQCCDALIPRDPKTWKDELGREHSDQWRDTLGKYLCDRCMYLHCYRVLSPGPSRWVHRPLADAGV